MFQYIRCDKSYYSKSNVHRTSVLDSWNGIDVENCFHLDPRHLFRPRFFLIGSRRRFEKLLHAGANLRERERVGERRWRGSHNHR